MKKQLKIFKKKFLDKNILVGSSFSWVRKNYTIQIFWMDL